MFNCSSLSQYSHLLLHVFFIMNKVPLRPVWPNLIFDIMSSSFLHLWTPCISPTFLWMPLKCLPSSPLSNSSCHFFLIAVCLHQKQIQIFMTYMITFKSYHKTKLYFKTILYGGLYLKGRCMFPVSPVGFTPLSPRMLYFRARQSFSMEKRKWFDFKFKRVFILI